MKDFKKILVMYQLKEVYRTCHVLDRRESSAEHSWSSMILADYFLGKMKLKLDRERVMDILLYHDLVEVEAGDTYVHDKKALKTKEKREKEGLEKLKEKMPKVLLKKYVALYGEYKECKTAEARFANAIDKLDPIVHSLEKAHSWAEWDLSEEDVREVKEKHLVFSQEFMNILDDLIQYLKRKNLIR
ncbi:MAG: HD domain-containing protein [Candidatus Moranbacteria bacterium]|nr:HD domain-containing protein [Candidatus Moranbacteria bacterium]